MRKVGGMASSLVVTNQHQRPFGIQDWLGNDADQQQPHLRQRQRRRPIGPAHPYPHQKMMCQQHQAHMMMPPQPRAGFVLTSSKLSSTGQRMPLIRTNSSTSNSSAALLK